MDLRPVDGQSSVKAILSRFTVKCTSALVNSSYVKIKIKSGYSGLHLVF